MPKLTGTVRWFSNIKGYGFLGRDDGGPDVFVHYTAIETDGYKTLREGEPVSYDIIRGEKGLQADRVVSLRCIPRPQSLPSDFGLTVLPTRSI